VLVVVEGVAVGDLGVDAADGEVHLGKAPSGVVGLLAVDGDVADLAAVRLDELLTADEHAARAAAGVIDAAFVWCEHGDEHADDVRRRVELAALLALSARELGEEVLVDLAEDVLGAVGGAAEADVAHEVDELAKAFLVQAGARVVLGENALERWIVAFDRAHGVVDKLADRRLWRVSFEVRPASFLRHPEDVDGAVLVRVLGIRALGALRFEFGMFRLERVGNVLEENETESDVLVLRSIHVVTQRVRGRPQGSAKVG